MLDLNHALVPRRSLLDSRQRLGIVPTWWFWNSWEQQRLLLPLALLIAVPLGLACFALQVLGVSIWLTTAFCLVSPIVFQGLVERHIRASLARRSLTRGDAS
jgi:hypothetical protein